MQLVDTAAGEGGAEGAVDDGVEDEDDDGDLFALWGVRSCPGGRFLHGLTDGQL